MAPHRLMTLPAHFPFFLASFTWNYGLGMTWLAVPLYAHALGLSGSQIGVLFSAPVILQVTITMVGGAYADRFGGRLVMLLSSLLVACGAALYLAASGFWMLFAGQLVMVIARATFWPANWAIAAELPGDRGVQAGRLNAVSNLGQILGNATCGFVLATAGFAASFTVMGALGLAAWAAGLGTPRPGHRGGASRGLFENYRTLIRMRVLQYGVLCAYLSALPFSLSLSFYPLLLQFLGFTEEASGILIALRAVGGIGAGLVIARFVRSGPASLWPVASGVLTAIGVGFQPLFTHWMPVGVLLLAVGIASGIMTVYFQVTLGDLVEPAMRGSAMALGGLGWGLSHFSTPLIMGLMTDRYGIVAGFYALGAVSLAVAVMIALLRPWAFARSALAGA